MVEVSEIRPVLKIERRASSATEYIAEAAAAASRPLMRTASGFIRNLQNVDGLNLPNNMVFERRERGHISKLRTQSLMPMPEANAPSFANLPVKKDAKSLAHLCGFRSLSLLF
jgi:hypothetical protein